MSHWCNCGRCTCWAEQQDEHSDVTGGGRTCYTEGDCPLKERHGNCTHVHTADTLLCLHDEQSTSNLLSPAALWSAPTSLSRVFPEWLCCSLYQSSKTKCTCVHQELPTRTRCATSVPTEPSLTSSRLSRTAGSTEPAAAPVSSCCWRAPAGTTACARAASQQVRSAVCNQNMTRFQPLKEAADLYHSC